LLSPVNAKFPFASAVVVAAAAPLSVTVAPVVFAAGARVPEMLKVAEVGSAGVATAGAADVVAVVPQPTSSVNATAPQIAKTAILSDRVSMAPLSFRVCFAEC
jgi:hypothetical protein